MADFGVVYGLGLQGLGMARIESNLLPKSIARSMAWESKTKYFVGAALMLLTVSGLCLGRVLYDSFTYSNGSTDATRVKTSRVVSEAKKAINAAGGITNQEADFQGRMKKDFEWFRYRDIIPQLHEILIAALPNAKNNPEQKDLYDAFARGYREGQAGPAGGPQAVVPDHDFNLFRRRSGEGPIPADDVGPPGTP